jgi:hypothetical protein
MNQCMERTLAKHSIELTELKKTIDIIEDFLLPP